MSQSKILSWRVNPSKNFATKDGIQEIVLKDWEEFHDLVARDFSMAPAFVYRGQTDYEWPVRSSIDRHEARYPKRKNLCGSVPQFFDRPPFFEEDHLNAFRRAIRGRRGDNASPLTDDECWALGQHHGLVTPLLDWTRSPYVALFFAMEEELRRDNEGKLTAPEFRVVYGLSTVTILPETMDATNDSKDIVGSKLRIVSPMSDSNSHLISQSGLFLYMPRGIDLESYVRQSPAKENPSATLKKIKIPNTERSECLVVLNKMNINYMTLFPDFNGAARHVNSLWQPGHEDSIAHI